MDCITIHRGARQIGGCFTEICAGGHRLVIDFGAELPGSRGGSASDEELAKKLLSPKPDAVLFTHYHGDHMGLYKRVPEGVPMYIGKTAKRLMEILTRRVDAAHPNQPAGLPVVRGMKTYKPGEWAEFGPIRVMPLSADHSALDAYMFLLEAGGKRILYTGDFREHGITGENGELEKTLTEKVGKADVLVTEGTMLSRTAEERDSPIVTEEDLGRKAGEIFRQHRENVVLVSSMNLDSVMEFFHAVPPDMAFACDEYQAELILAAIDEMGGQFPRYKRPYIGSFARNMYILGTMKTLGWEQGCYPAKIRLMEKKGFVMLARENRQDGEEKNRFTRFMDKYLDSPNIAYSKWRGYLDENHGGAGWPTVSKDINAFLGPHPFVSLHTSGHAYTETLEKLFRLTDPKTIIPMHTQSPEAFAALPRFALWRDRVHPLRDGEAFPLK